jgi:hypothetical protein
MSRWASTFVTRGGWRRPVPWVEKENRGRKLLIFMPRLGLR